MKLQVSRSLRALPTALPLLVLLGTAQAQKTSETSQDLSKGARKGIITNAILADDGNVRVTFQTKMDKKSSDIVYEDYLFDPSLGFKGVQTSKEGKAVKPPKTSTGVFAYVGGTNSFTVLSQTLRLSRESWESYWNYRSQKYDRVKRLSQETVKPRNSESKYKGFASFDYDDGSVCVLASYDQDKEDADQFVLLSINSDLAMKETKVPISGAYSLVYCNQKANGNVFAVFAPNKGMPDTKKYVYTEFTPAGDVVANLSFTAPSPNMAIMGGGDAQGALYLVAGSTKSNDAFNQEFSSYAPIFNPGYPAAANRQMDKFEKKYYDAEFQNLYLLKIAGGQLEFVSTTPVSQFKTKAVTPPSQKKAHPYDGKVLAIDDVVVTPAGDILVTGQKKEKEYTHQRGSYEYHYGDIVCLQFSKAGELKAQYAVEKMMDDSKSEKFSSPQRFRFSPDGTTAYWQIMEVKGTKGYDTFFDAWYGLPTFTANYFPRIAKINLAGNTVSDFTVFGNKGKFLMYNDGSLVKDEKANAVYYIGHDEDNEKVWVGKYQFE